MATDLFDARAPLAPPLAPRAGAPASPVVLDDRDGGGGGRAFDPARFGLWAFLGTVSMLFIGFTSAYIVRRTAVDWRALPVPHLLWWNTGALVLSGLALEAGRARWRSRDRAALVRWLGATAVLALGFAAGQFEAWRLLAAAGYFLASNPHSSFFYLLSGVHLVHVGGGLVWFALVGWRLRPGRRTEAGADRELSLFATYWHFLAVLWVYVMVLIFGF